ncbi:MAG: putative quinol monooxygenase [Gammaproteobacteria bacterium]
MIELQLMLRAPPRKTRVLIAALRSLAKSARADAGCFEVRLLESVEDRRCVSYSETWDSEKSLRRMIASRHFSQLAALMEMAAAPPECRFREIGEVRGLEYAAQVRNCAESAAD